MAVITWAPHAIISGTDRMAESFDRRPNERLRYQRKLRGWTLDDVAEQLHRQTETSPGAELGVDAHMVGRWERGVRRPSPRYVAQLCRLFGLSADQLGLVDGEQHTALKEKDVERRQFLQYLSVVSGATMLDWDRLWALMQGGVSADQRMLDDLDTLTKNYARQAETMAPGTLLPALRSHMNVLTGALHASHPPAVRSRLASLTGEAALLAGRASWILDNRGDARSCWSLALDLAREVGDSSLTAKALVFHRELHSTAPSRGRYGSPQRAIAILDQAEAELDSTSSPYVRVFVLASRAEDHAAAGDADAADRDLDRAETALESATSRDDGYFVRWDSARIAGYRGSCALSVNRPHQAAAILEPALKHTSELLARQRCDVIIDLAAAYAQQSEVERSCGLLSQAVESASRAGLVAELERALGARQHLTPWQESPHVKQLDERLLAFV
jgi:transcriptional regulator with XRE-family HTH domain